MEEKFEHALTAFEELRVFTLALKLLVDENAQEQASLRDSLEVRIHQLESDQVARSLASTEVPDALSLEANVPVPKLRTRFEMGEDQHFETPSRSNGAFPLSSESRAFPDGRSGPRPSTTPRGTGTPRTTPRPKVPGMVPLTPAAAITLLRSKSDPQYDANWDPTINGPLTNWKDPTVEQQMRFQESGAYGPRPKLPEPKDFFPPFGGRTEDPTSTVRRLNEFISRLSLIMTARNLPTDVYMSYLPQLLAHDALDWYSGKLRLDWSETPYAIDIFVQRLLDRYITKGESLNAEKALAKWRFPDPKYPGAGTWFAGFANACRNVHTNTLGVASFLSLLNSLVDLYIITQIHAANPAPPHEFKSIDEITPIFENIVTLQEERIRYDALTRRSREDRPRRDDRPRRERTSDQPRSRGLVRSDRHGRYSRPDAIPRGLDQVATATPHCHPSRYNSTKAAPVAKADNARFDDRAAEAFLNQTHIKRCYGCGEAGHIRANCTNNSLERKHGRVGAIKETCRVAGFTVAAIGHGNYETDMAIEQESPDQGDHVQYGADGLLHIGAVGAAGAYFTGSDFSSDPEAPSDTSEGSDSEEEYYDS